MAAVRALERPQFATHCDDKRVGLVVGAERGLPLPRLGEYLGACLLSSAGRATGCEVSRSLDKCNSYPLPHNQ